MRKITIASCMLLSSCTVETTPLGPSGTLAEIGACPEGQAIRDVMPDGTVVCEVVDPDARSCTPGTYVQAVAADGTLACGDSLDGFQGGTVFGNVNVSDRLGVGVSSQEQLIHIRGAVPSASGAGIRLENSLSIPDNYWDLSLTNDGNLAFEPEGAIPGLTLARNGRAGVHRSSPLAWLHLDGSTEENGFLEGIRIERGSVPGQYGIMNQRGGGMHFVSTVEGGGDYGGYGFFASNDGSSELVRMVIDVDGNVGIGTSSPTALLHVLSGNVLFQGAGREVYVERNSDDSAAHSVAFQKSRGSPDSPTAVQSADLLGTLSWRGYDGVDYVAGARIEALVESAPGPADMPTYLRFLTTADGAASSAERMRITSSGNIGIGTTAPIAPLTVVGAVPGTPTLYINTNGSDTVEGLAIQFGTSNFSVEGVGGGTLATSLKNTGGPLILQSGNQDVGIGTVTPNSRLHVNGTICQDTDGNGSCDGTVSSDVRLKRNIVTLTGTRPKVRALRGVTFEWRDDVYPAKHFGHGKQIGFVAQELEQVYPELVYEDAQGYKMVDYQKMTAVLVEAIKEQQTEIDRVHDENRALHGRLEDVESRLASMERRGGSSAGMSAASSASAGSFGGRKVFLAALLLGAGWLAARRRPRENVGVGGVR